MSEGSPREKIHFPCIVIHSRIFAQFLLQTDLPVLKQPLLHGEEGRDDGSVQTRGGRGEVMGQYILGREGRGDMGQYILGEGGER